MQTPRSRGGSSRAELGVFGLQAADPLVLTVSGSRARQTSSSTPQPVRVVVGPAQLLSASWWGKGCRRPEQRPAMPAQRGPGPTTVHAAAAAGSAARRTCACPALSHPRAPATPRGGSSCPLRKSSERRPCRRSELEVFRYCARLRRPRRLAKKLQPTCTSCLPSGTRPRRWAAPPPPPRGIHASLCTCPLWGATADLRAAPLGGRPRHARGGSRRRRSAVLSAVTRA